ncbi:MAG: T9SS type A sorting domain-containing protein [Bacteroidota bacterium]
MKKLIFTTLSTLVFVGAFAQSQIDNRKMKHIKAENRPVKSTSNTYGKIQISDWYNTIDFSSSDPIIGGSIQHYVGFIQHDSLAKIYYADGTISKTGWESVGSVLDPKDAAIDLTNNPGIKLSKWNGYTLDSIRFTYLYVRNVDSFDIYGLGQKKKVIDTLFVHYFKGTDIKKSYIQPTGGAKSLLAMLGWNIPTRLPATFSHCDTVLLTQNDSTTVNNSTGGFENGFRTKSMVLAAPTAFTIAAGGNLASANDLVGFTFTFKSAVPTVYGTDTAIQLYQLNPNTLPAGSHRTNYFGFYFAENTNTTPWSNPTYYNTTLLAGAAYATRNGWTGFISGNAYNSEIFADADFKLTTAANVSVREIKNDNFAMSSVYPNPANNNDGAYIGFNLKNESNVSFEIVSLMGQKVKAFADKTFAAGQNGMELNLTGVDAGVYFVNMTVNGLTQTKKLIVQ